MSDDAAREQPQGPDAPKRRGRSRRKHTIGRVLLASAVVLALATGLGVVYLYRHLNGNLDVVDVSEQLGTDRPEKKGDTGPQEPLNVLVMGSDDRDAAGNNIDNQELGSSDRSDTTILMHLSADRKRAYGVSIPRDSLVTRPTCRTEDGEAIPGGTDVMWNEAFALGGPACTIRQFEENTGVFVDHYVVIDFAGFEGMVNAIDGVPVCIPEPIVDPAHGINIEKGTREVEGREALNYVRARYTLGDGSDISRIKRQQAFIAAMANKVISAGTLARVDRLVGFLNAATDSLQVDPGLDNVIKIAKMGVGFQGIGLENIQFVTVPFEYDQRPEYSGRVSWLPQQSKALWSKIAEDQPLTKRLTSDAINAAKPTGSEKEKSGPPQPVSPEEAEEAEANGLCA
jgi:LCP family protein required for cell wall assembly